MRRLRILRIAVYSSLLLLIVLTAYIRLYRNPLDEAGRHNPAAQRIYASQPDSGIPAPPEGPAPPDHLLAPLETGAVASTEGKAGVPDAGLGGKAKQKFTEGNYREALNIFLEISEKDPSALTGAGLCYFKLGDYSNAIIVFNRAIENNPNEFAARKFLAFAYYKADDPEKSADETAKALTINYDPDLKALSERLARERRTERNYIKESSSHFKISFDGYEHGGLERQITGILEDAYRFVGKELNYFPADTVAVVLYTGKDFYDTTEAPSWSCGIYDGKIRIPVKGAEGQSEALKKVLFHEYTHVVVHSLTQRCPRWIDEGLAEYFSTANARKTGQTISLRSLENSFSRLGGDNVRLAYRESYSAVSYLIERYGLYRMKEMLLSLSKGADLNRAFKAAFSESYDDFIAEWGKT